MPNILELHGLTKHFPGVVALDHVDLDIREGEVHILVGENGAGKSSLVKVLCGIYPPDGGEMLYQGAPYSPQTPLDAIRAGIRVVYQEFNLLPYLSVAENIFFERLPQHGGLVDYPHALPPGPGRARRGGARRSPPAPPSNCSAWPRCSSSRSPRPSPTESKVLILDEPTATLTPQGDRPAASRSSPASRAAA